MILLPVKLDATPPNADDGGHHTNRVPRCFEVRSLFDVGLEIADITIRLQTRRRYAIESGRHQGVSQAPALGIGGRVYVFLAHHAAKGSTAQTPEVGGFFVDPGYGVNREITRGGILGQGAHDFEPVDDTHSSI